MFFQNQIKRFGFGSLFFIDFFKLSFHFLARPRMQMFNLNIRF